MPFSLVGSLALLSGFDEVKGYAGEAHVEGSEGGLGPTASKELKPLIQQPQESKSSQWPHERAGKPIIPPLSLQMRLQS